MVTSQDGRHLGLQAWQKDFARRTGARARSVDMIGALVGRVPGRRSLRADPSAEQTLAVLAGARAMVARGWLQGAWYVLQAPDGRRRFVGPGSLVRRSFGEIVQSCVVGAVVESARWHTAEKGAAGPAIDTLWHELGELSGRRPPADPWPPTPVVRRREVGELTTWNDTPGRSREEVLRLLDAAIARLAPAPDAATATSRRDDGAGGQSSSASTDAARTAPSGGTGRYSTAVPS